MYYGSKRLNFYKHKVVCEFDDKGLLLTVLKTGFAFPTDPDCHEERKFSLELLILRAEFA